MNVINIYCQLTKAHEYECTVEEIPDIKIKGASLPEVKEILVHAISSYFSHTDYSKQPLRYNMHFRANLSHPSI